MIKIYQKMRRLCTKKGISIHALEQKAGLGNGTIDNWERHKPRLGTLDKVARALDLPLVELISILGWTYKA